MAPSKENAPKKLPKSLRKGRLPRSIGDVWTAGVGALAQARKTGSDSFDALVGLGATVADTGSKAAQGAVGQVEAAAGRLAGTASGVADGAVETVVESVLARIGVPGRDEVLALREQVEALQDRLATLNARPAGGGRARAESAPAKTASAAPDRAVYRVARHERGWSVQRDGTERAASVHPTKKEALREARQTARAHGPSRLVVYKADGAVGEETDYGA